MRLPFFVVALVAAVLVVLLETGAGLMIGGQDVSGALADHAAELSATLEGGGELTAPSGRAIGYLALVDGILLFTVALMAAGLVLPQRWHARAQGVVTIIVAVLLILTAIVMIVVALIELITMVVLLLAFPFGTIVYLALWGSFPRGDAALLLALVLFLKYVFAAALLLAQQRFLQNKGLVLLVATSAVCTILVAFIHGMVPGILVSIADDVAAIIVAIVAVVWAVVLIIGAVPSVVKAAKSLVPR